MAIIVSIQKGVKAMTGKDAIACRECDHESRILVLYLCEVHGPVAQESFELAQRIYDIIVRARKEAEDRASETSTTEGRRTGKETEQQASVSVGNAGDCGVDDRVGDASENDDSGGNAGDSDQKSIDDTQGSTEVEGPSLPVTIAKEEAA